MPFDLTALAGSLFAVAGFAATATADQVRQTDAEFLSAASESDAARLEHLIDPDVSWTDAAGQTFGLPGILTACPAPADQDGAEVETRLYGDVAVVTSRRNSQHAMRVLVRRGIAWRVLVYHEVAHTPGAAPAHVSPSGVDTDNPCRSIPYEPRSAAERALIESWQELERAVAAGDGDEWARHVTDDFVVIGNQRIQTMAERRAAVSKGGAAPPPLVSARLFEFGDAIVMSALHQPHGRKASVVSRVFVRDGRSWLMAISYQTTIQAAAPPTV